MALQEALAALLLPGPSHGYYLAATLEGELGPLWETRASRLYLTLARMEQEGIVTSVRVRQDNRPDRRLLSLTSRGRAIATEWLAGAGSTEDAVVRLAVARVASPDDFGRLASVLGDQRTSRIQRLRELRREAGDGFQTEAINAEIAKVQAELRWLSLVRDRSDEILKRPRGQRRHGSSSAERAG
jgi:DNA-binding PadR family transcriptional regulator